MSRASLGARARRGPLLTLAAMAAVVVAGTVTVLGFAAAAGTSPWLVLPLAVIGALAVPAAGHELAVARREEIGLARLRGVHGARLVVFLLAEPLTAILLGAVAGVALGVAGTWLSTWLWLDAPEVALSGSTPAAVAAVVAVGLLGVFVGMASARSEPLSDQVSIATRTRPASTAATFGSVLIIVAAVIAVYRSGRGTDPDWVVLAGPALVGLAAGQVTVWLLRVVSRIATARTANSAMPAFLATRRVGRTADGGSALRLLVAAGAVATLAATGAAGVAGWADQSGRITAGAPLRVDLRDTAQAALAKTEKHDPDGRFLMAAVLVPDAQPARRRAFVDTSRYDAVIGDFYDGTGAASVADDAEALVADRPPLATGDLLSATAEAFPVRVPQTPPRAIGATQVSVDYVTAEGSPGRAVLRLLGAPDGIVEASEPLERCDKGCVVRGLLVETGVQFGDDFFVIGDDRLTDFNPGRATTLTSLQFGDVELVDEEWKVSGAGERPPEDTGTIEPTDAGLVVTTGASGVVRADAAAATQQVPVLATPGLSFGETGPEVDGPGGDTNPAEIRAELPALPLVGAAGLFGDLRTALYGSSPTVPAAQVAILAAADTPADVLAALVDEGGTVHTLDGISTTVERDSGAVQAWMYAVMAGCCLLVALLALLAAGGRQRAAYRRDVASLRVVGVPTREIRSAGLGELVLLAAVAVVAGVGAGLLAARLLLSDLPLVAVPEFAIPLVPVSSVLPALAIGLALALIVVVVVGRGRRIDPELTRPAILREGVAR